MVAGIRAKLARSLGIGRSSSYYQTTKPAQDSQLKEQIELAWVEHPAYGHKRLALHLGIGKNRILRVMRQFGLIPAVRRQPKRQPGSTEPKLIRPNLIANLTPSYAQHIWASDFTYLWFGGHWHYLATVVDLYTRRIVGWSIGRRHTAQLIHLAVCDALSRHEPPGYFHSDQGSEYTAAETVTLVEATGATCSWSAKASPWQNGYQESLYQNFKLELGDPNRFESEGELFEAIARQIYYYNNLRIHTALKMPPIQFYEASLRLGVEKAGP